MEKEKEYILNYIRNNFNENYLKDRIDIVLSIMYEIEDYLDYQNETVDKVIDLLQEEKIFH